MLTELSDRKLIQKYIGAVISGYRNKEILYKLMNEIKRRENITNN